MLTNQDRASLIQLLAEHVPATMVIDVVREQQVLSEKEFDLVRKKAPQDTTLARGFIGEQVFAAYEAQGKVRALAYALYQRAYLDDIVGPLLVKLMSVAESSEPLSRAQQGAIAIRANTLSSLELRRFMDANKSKVCVIVAEHAAALGTDPRVGLGTGFLVGPDLVLTAYHTLRGHISNQAPVIPAPGPCYALFDYHEGGPLQDPVEVPDGSIKIPFHDDWLLACNEDLPSDGLFLQPDAQQAALLPSRLDFALVRLAVPVGKQTRRSLGGVRRSWIRLTVPGSLRQHDRIIIPQHPNGSAQRIDFGRYSQPDSNLDTSQTRLRYDTETDEGTSGAPCFDQRFAVVGMHNAAFKPNGVVVKKNQAIRLDRILAALAAVPEVSAASTAPEIDAAPLWNASTDPTPRVILGREILLGWLTKAAVEESSGAADRAYAAFVKAESSKTKDGSKGYGKSFTLRIQMAARRGMGEPLVILGTEDNLLPDNASDFLRAIGYQLGMDKQLFDDMPPRPAADLPTAAPNADKLRKWASEDLPAWFDTKLAAFREQRVDRKAEARKRIEALRSFDLPPLPEDMAILEQPDGQIDVRRRWPIAWIAIEGLQTAHVAEEVRDLIAGMIGGKVAEESMPQQLRRLRWLFLGCVPDFVSSEYITRELLDPLNVGATDLVRAFSAYADSMAIEIPPAAQGFVQIFASAFLNVPGTSLQDPREHLRILQEDVFPSLVEGLRQVVDGAP